MEQKLDTPDMNGDAYNLKIAHIASPYYTDFRTLGATVSMIADLATLQVRQGHEVVVFSGFNGKINSIVNVESFIKPSKGDHWITDWLKRRIYGAIHAKKVFQQTDYKFDIIHNHLSEEGITCSVFSKCPHLTTLHGQAFPDKLLYRSILRMFALVHKTKLIAISKSSYELHRRIYGEDLLGYVYHGINTNNIKYNPTPVKNHDIELGVLARADPIKGIPTAIQIADELYTEGLDIQLTLVLRYEPRYPEHFLEIQRLIAGKKHIRLLKDVPHSDIFDIVSNLDALLFPTLIEEPFGMAQIESMATGTPVLAFSLGASKEIIQHGVNGFICKDKNDMKANVRRIKEISRSMCREIIEKKFDVHEMASGYMKFYETVIALYQKNSKQSKSA